MIIMGIDPGTTGAMAVISPETVEVYDLPTHNVGTMKQIDPYELIESIRVIDPDIAFVEQVHANAISYKGNFALGHALGCIITALIATNTPFHRIQPKEWQQATGLTGVPAKSRKTAHRARALELYPNVRTSLARLVDHNRADALLIAEAGRRTRTLTG